MRSLSALLGAALLFLAACDAPVSPNAISTEPASAPAFALVQRAVSICGRNFPALERRASDLRAAGFREATRYQAINELARYAIYEHPNADVLVGLANRQQRVCLVGLKGMTPQQSFALAQPWVRRYGATTNAENGQGLSNKAVQAWRSENLDRTVFIAAFKSFDQFDEPGAAVRLFNFD